MVRELPTSKSSESSEQAETSTKNEDSTVAGSVKTNKLDPDDVLPEVVTTKSTNEDNNLPPVRSGSQPGPDEFESYDFDEHRDLMLPNNVRTYAGGQFYRETELPSLGPMSLPNRQRYRPEYDSVLGATSPRSPSSAYQFAPRSHFLRSHSGRGRTAYPVLFELRIKIFREIQNLALFNQYIPEITKILRLTLREERVDVQGVQKHPQGLGVTLTFHIYPHNFMDENLVGEIRRSMLQTSWDWREYYATETYDTLYFFLENCEVILCRMMGNRRGFRGRGNDKKQFAVKNQRNHRSRQNLVKREYETVKKLLQQWLVADKTYLRGRKVAFIQVKCPGALKKNAAFISSIVNDENVTICRATVPLSRKKEGQLKGFLVYLETSKEEDVTYIMENLFTEEYQSSGIKCKYGVFSSKKSITAPDSQTEV